jgi:hypothetical protein
MNIKVLSCSPRPPEKAEQAATVKLLASMGKKNDRKDLGSWPSETYRPDADRNVLRGAKSL